MSRFDAWMVICEPGESFVYHTGSVLGGSNVRSVRMAYNHGYIELVQRRIEHAEGPNGLGRFEYIAQRKRVPRPPREPFEVA